MKENKDNNIKKLNQSQEETVNLNKEKLEATDIKDFIKGHTETRQKINKAEKRRKRKRKIKHTTITKAQDIDKVYYNFLDRFFIKIWAFICSIVSGCSNIIYKSIKYIFRIAPPLKYIKALVTLIFIFILYILLSLPILIPLQHYKEKYKDTKDNSKQIEKKVKVKNFDLNSKVFII